MDKSTDKLRDHVCDKGGEGVKKSEIFMDVINGSPLTEGVKLKDPANFFLKFESCCNLALILLSGIH